MIYLLIIILFILLFIAYYTSNKEICSPAVLFIAPFLVMSIIAAFFQKEWSFELSFYTLIVVVIGNLSFFLGTKLIKVSHFSDINTEENSKNDISISNSKYIIMIIIQSICYLTKIKYIIDYGVAHGIANNLSKCLVYYNNVLKFTTEETIKFPIWLQIGLDVCAVFGFICACTLANKIVTKSRKNINTFLLILNYAIAVAGGLSSGGRGGAIQPLIALLCSFLILYQRKNNWKKPISLKIMLLVGGGLIGIVYLFYKSLTWIGRYDVYLVGRYISNYIGAQIFNLNHVLNSGYKTSTIIGQETFYPLIEKISGLLGISNWSNYHIGDSSVYAAGYSTGNVYTCFYSYIRDFGFIGVIILPFIFGVFFQIVYKYARNSTLQKSVNFGLVVYCYFSYMILFSFFADKFGTIIFTFNMLKRIIILYLLYVMIFNVELDKSTIRIYKKRKIKNININL